jgi:hypothetical protein
MMTILAILLLLTFTPMLPAQVNEYVVNGNFDQSHTQGWTLLPFSQPIEFAHGVYSVSGVEAPGPCLTVNPGSSNFGGSGFFGMYQDIIVPANKTLTVSLDAACVPRAVALPYAYGTQVSITLSSNGHGQGKQTRFSAPITSHERLRASFGVIFSEASSVVTARLTVNLTGPYQSILGTTPLAHIDNISVQEANGATIHIDGFRYLGDRCTLRIEGSAGPFQLFVSPIFLTQPLSLPGWTGLWELDPITMIHLLSGNLGPVTISLRPPVAPEVSGVPLYWQALSIDTTVLPQELMLGNGIRAGFF